MEWGSLTVAEILKGTGAIALPFILGKWLWKKAVTEEIQKVGEKADAAAKAANAANESVRSVPPLVAEFSGKVAEDLSKMSIHYAEAVKTTAEAKELMHATQIKIKTLEDHTDIELTKHKLFGGKFAVRLKKVEEDVEQLKVGKVTVIDKGKKKP